MTIDELIRDFKRRAAEAEAVQATAPVAQVYRTLIEELGHVSVSETSPRRPTDRLLTVPELAMRLNVDERYVYDHHHEWPFTRRLGRKLRFSERGLEQWMRQRQR